VYPGAGVAGRSGKILGRARALDLAAPAKPAGWVGRYCGVRVWNVAR